MGLDVNLIKTGVNALNKICIARAKDGTKVLRLTKVVELPKNSRLRNFGFSEMTHCADGWSLRGENIWEWFSSGEKEKLQKFIREHTTGTTVTEYGNKKIVQFGNNKSVNDGLLGFIKEEDSTRTIYNTKCGAFSFEWWEKIKIKDFLKKISGEPDTTKKWTIQTLDKHLREDFSEEMIKPVHDYLEGKINKQELLDFIKKYRKNMPYNPSLAESNTSLQSIGITIPACFVPEKILNNLKIPEYMRNATLYDIYYFAEKGDNTAKALIEEFNKAQGFLPDKRTTIYRFIGKEELDKILAGKVVKPGLNYQSDAFDVTTRTHLYDDCYRVKFKIEASENTIPKTIREHKCEDEFYYWNTPGYTIKDVRSILDQKHNSLIYESDEEILSRFIDEYISKLG